MIRAMQELRIQQHFIDSADLHYQVSETLAKPIDAAVQALLASVTGGGKVLVAGVDSAVALAQYLSHLLVRGFERERPGDSRLEARTPRQFKLQVRTVGLVASHRAWRTEFARYVQDHITGLRVRVLRDPTRGGVAATLNEIAHQSQRGIWLDEASLPVDAAVQSACELLGLDPLNLACEGRVLVVCPAEAKEAALDTLRRHPLGAGAACIGACVAEPPGVVQMRTRLGGTRLIDWLSADPLPRIC